MLRVFEPDALQVLGVVLGCIVSVQRNGLIADDAAAPVHLVRVHAPGIHVVLGSGHNELACLMHLEQVCKVPIARARELERTGLQRQNIQHIDLVYLAVADVDEGWAKAMKRNCSAEVWRRTPTSPM